MRLALELLLLAYAVGVTIYCVYLSQGYRHIIRKTTTLVGKDAERFRENMKNQKPMSKEESERMLKHYNKFPRVKTERGIVRT